MLGVRARRLLLPLGRAGPLFGLGGFPACTGSLLVGCRGLPLRSQPARGSLFAVLCRDLAPVVELSLTLSPQRRREQSDHDYGADHDQNNCDCAHFRLLSMAQLLLSLTTGSSFRHYPLRGG